MKPKWCHYSVCCWTCLRARRDHICCTSSLLSLFSFPLLSLALPCPPFTSVATFSCYLLARTCILYSATIKSGEKLNKDSAAPLCQTPTPTRRTVSLALMYRGSVLGLALAATLAEMDPPLTSRQAEEVWGVFDASMADAVAQAPLVSSISVQVPPPSSVGGAGTTVVSTVTPSLYIPAQPPGGSSSSGVDVPTTREEGTAKTAEVDAPRASSPSPDTFDDSHIAFPVSRHVDGVWTILLKDPTVVVRDKLGNSEKMQLDYLKVCLHDLNPFPSQRGRQ